MQRNESTFHIPPPKKKPNIHLCKTRKFAIFEIGAKWWSFTGGPRRHRERHFWSAAANKKPKAPTNGTRGARRGGGRARATGTERYQHNGATDARTLTNSL